MAPKRSAFENVWWALHMSWIGIGVKYNFCCTFKWKLFTKEKFVRMFHQFIWLLFNEFIDSKPLQRPLPHTALYINFSYDLFIYLCLFVKNINYFGSMVSSSVCTRVGFNKNTYTIVCNECVCSSRHVVYRIHSHDAFALNTFLSCSVPNDKHSAKCKIALWLKRFCFISNMPFDAPSFLASAIIHVHA